MHHETMKGDNRVNGCAPRNSGLATCSDNSRALSDLQAQHLSVIFGLPADTASTIAELLFGEARS